MNEMDHLMLAPRENMPRKHERYEGNKTPDGQLNEFTVRHQKFKLKLRKDSLNNRIEEERMRWSKNYPNKNSDEISNLEQTNKEHNSNDIFSFEEKLNKISQDIVNNISLNTYDTELIKQIKDMLTDDSFIYAEFSELLHVYTYTKNFLLNENYVSNLKLFLDLLSVFNNFLTLPDFSFHVYLNSPAGLDDLNSFYKVFLNVLKSQNEMAEYEHELINKEITLILYNITQILQPENVDAYIISEVLNNYFSLIANVTDKKNKKKIELNLLDLLYYSVTNEINLVFEVFTKLLEIVNSSKSKKVFQDCLKILVFLMKSNSVETVKIFNEHNYLIEKTIEHMEILSNRSNKKYIFPSMVTYINFLNEFIITNSSFLQQFNLKDFLFKLMNKERIKKSDVLSEIVNLLLQFLDSKEIGKLTEKEIESLCEIFNENLAEASNKVRKTAISIFFLIVKSENFELIKTLYEKDMLEIIIKSILLDFQSDENTGELLQGLKIFFILSKLDKEQHEWERMKQLRFVYELNTIFSYILYNNRNSLTQSNALNILNLIDEIIF